MPSSERASKPWGLGRFAIGREEALLLAVLFVIILVGAVALYFELGRQWFLDLKAFIGEYGLIGVFFLTLVAGTVVPVGSPAVTAIGAGFGLPPVPLAITAASGYTVGIVISYFLGYLGRPIAARRLRSEAVAELTRLWEKHGWKLCAAFALVPGLPLDLLAMVCGFLKMRLRVLVPVSFFALLVQFLVFAHIGEYLGRLIGIY